MFETTNQILMIIRVYHVPIRHWAVKKIISRRGRSCDLSSCPKPIFQDLNRCVLEYGFGISISGWWLTHVDPTPLKNDGLRQLG